MTHTQPILRPVKFSEYHSEMNMSTLQQQDSALCFWASSPQPYRGTSFLSLNWFPVLADDVLERGGEMPHSPSQGPEMLLDLS